MKPISDLLTLSLLACLAACGASPRIDRSVAADPLEALQGTWEGDLRVVHAPNHPGAPETHRYQLNFAAGSLDAHIFGGECTALGKAVALTATETHYSFLITKSSDSWLQEVFIVLIRNGEDEMFAYSTRVVDNFREPDSSTLRHFPVAVEGKVRRASSESAHLSGQCTSPAA